MRVLNGDTLTPEMVLTSVDEVVFDAANASFQFYKQLQNNLQCSNPKYRSTLRFDWGLFNEQNQTELLSSIRHSLKPTQEGFFISLKHILALTFDLGLLFGTRREMSLADSEDDTQLLTLNAQLIVEKLKELKKVLSWPNVHRFDDILEPAHITAKMKGLRDSAKISMNYIARTIKSYSNVFEEHPNISFNAFVFGFEYDLANRGEGDYFVKLGKRLTVPFTSKGLDSWCAVANCVVAFVPTMETEDHDKFRSLLHLKRSELLLGRTQQELKEQHTATNNLIERLNTARINGRPIPPSLLYSPSPDSS